MFKLFAVFMIMSIAFVSCEKDTDEFFSQNDEIVLKSQPVAGAYVIDFTATIDELTFVIDQSGAQDISHMLFRFTDCDDNYLTIDDVTSVTVNGDDWNDVVDYTGAGTGCNFGDDSPFPFIKLDNFEFNGGTIDVVIEIDGVVAVVEYLIKSGSNCFPFYDVTDLCGDEPDFFNPLCYEWQTETAWSAGARYVNRGNWATYSTYIPNTTVSIFAGQTMEAGTVLFSEIDNDNKVTITITLNDGWHLAIFDKDINGYDIGEENLETVKIQGYDVAPKRNPAPGQFADKGNLLEVTVPAATFYGIHLDVGLLTEIECPEEE